MHVHGHYRFYYPPQIVWDTLTNPELLERCIPGCERFAVVGPYTYEATMQIGVAALRGIYSGQAQLTDIEMPHHCKLYVKGGGGPGRVETHAHFSLRSDGTGTIVYYDGKVHFRGLLGFLPSGVLSPVAYHVVEAFFEMMASFIVEQDTLNTQGVERNLSPLD